MTKEERTIDRVKILAEAAELERNGGEWNAQHVAAVLGCAISTVYNTPWLLRMCKRVGKRGRRWVPAQVRAGHSATLPTPRRTGS